jgi:hypothetical protein
MLQRLMRYAGRVSGCLARGLWLCFDALSVPVYLFVVESLVDVSVMMSRTQ